MRGRRRAREVWRLSRGRRSHAAQNFSDQIQMCEPNLTELKVMTKLFESSRRRRREAVYRARTGSNAGTRAAATACQAVGARVHAGLSAPMQVL